MRRFATKPLVAIPLAGALLLSACSSDKQTPSDSMQIVAHPVAAVAAVSPAAAKKPAGQVLAEPSSVTAVENDPSTRTLAVALSSPPSLRIYHLDDLAAAPTTVALPGPVEHLSVSAGQFLASIPTKSEVAKVSVPAGQVTLVPVEGTPSAAIAVGAQLYVAVRDRKSVEVFDGTKLTKTIGGQLYSADDIVKSGDTTIVLDRLRTAVFRVDVAGGVVAEGLRAGDGATNAVADSYGRILVTDSRTSSLFAFSADPLLLRQQFPLPGGAYGIAYDAQRSLAWVTLTGSNEVVGLNVRGGQPVEKYRFATVRQPNSVTVDQKTGQVVIGSAAGEGTQVITP